MKENEECFHVLQRGSNFRLWGWNPKVWKLKWATGQYFLLALLIVKQDYSFAVLLFVRWINRSPALFSLNRSTHSLVLSFFHPSIRSFICQSLLVFLFGSSVCWSSFAFPTARLFICPLGCLSVRSSDRSFVCSSDPTACSFVRSSTARSFIHLSDRWFVVRSFVCPIAGSSFVHSFVRPLVRLSVWPLVCPSVRSFVCPSDRSFVRPSVRTLVRLSVRPLVCSSVRLSVRPSVRSFVSPNTTNLLKLYSFNVSLNLRQWNSDQRQILCPTELQWFSLLNFNGCVQQTTAVINSNHLQTQSTVLFSCCFSNRPPR